MYLPFLIASIWQENQAAYIIRRRRRCLLALTPNRLAGGSIIYCVIKNVWSTIKIDKELSLNEEAAVGQALKVSNMEIFEIRK